MAKKNSRKVLGDLGTGSADSLKAARAAIQVTTDASRDAQLTNFGRATLIDRYLLPGETTQDLFARVARAYVHGLAADAIQYRAALAFDQAIDVRAAGYPVPPVLLTGDTPAGTTYPDRTSDAEIAFIEGPSS